MIHSLLFVPGDRPERFAKAQASGADTIIIDLEDGVDPGAKEKARIEVQRFLAAGGRAMVRLNAADSPWFNDDLAALEPLAVAGLLLPKAEDPAVIEQLADKTRTIPILPMIETARGMDRLAGIASAPAVTRLVFGSIDFQLDLGIQGHDEALLLFRSMLVLQTRLAGLAAPIDGITASIHDLERLEHETRRAKKLGFGGKLCIHPKQIEIVARVFRVETAALEQARKIVAAAEHASHGAVLVDGQMVDRPVIEQARRVLAQNDTPAIYHTEPHQEPG